MENKKDNDLLKQGRMLPLMEEFYSIQGEGEHTGKAAYFIRVGGCEVGCNWCDEKESWNAGNHPLALIDNIIKNIVKCPAKAVLVTGGEPLQYNLDYLCLELKKKNIKTFLETCGTHELSGEWDWICLSPKRKSPPLKNIYNKADELKVIIYELSDFEWAEKNAAMVNEKVKLFLQPEWSLRETMIPLIVDYILKNPKWNISLQSHKYMNIP